MTKDLKASAVLIMGILLLQGCAALTPRKAMEAEGTADSRPANSYYYFAEAQLAKKKADTDRTIYFYKKATESQPDSIYLKKELALEYLRNEEAANALKVVEEMLTLDPENVTGWILYGRIQQKQNLLKEAIRAYSKVIELDKSQENVYMLLGGIYLQQDRLGSAEKLFKTAIQEFPSSYAAHYFLGKVYARQQRPVLAEGEFKQALQIEPALLEPRFELLELYRRQGKTNVIIKTYEEILEKNPGNIRASLELGLFLWKEGRKEEAQRIFIDLGRRSEDHFNVILRVIQNYLEPDRYDDAVIVIEGMLQGAPDSLDLHHLAGVAYYGKKNNEKAFEHFSQVTPESRFYEDSVVHLAFLQRDKGQRDSAVELLEKAVESRPDNADLLYYLATFYEESEDYDMAEDVLKRAIIIEPEETRLHFRLGVVYDKWGKKEDSIQSMKTVIKLDPKHANALNYLGYTYADLGQNLDEAERLVKEALKQKPEDGYITDSLGWVYYQRGEYGKALEILKHAVELVPDDPIILEHLGDAYLKMNDRENALKYYRMSLEKNNKDRLGIEEKIKRLEGEI